MKGDLFESNSERSPFLYSIRGFKAVEAFVPDKEIKKMRCLMKFEWVKLLRSHLPEGKGLMGMWARLASRAAFRKAKSFQLELLFMPSKQQNGHKVVRRVVGCAS